MTFNITQNRKQTYLKSLKKVKDSRRELGCAFAINCTCDFSFLSDLLFSGN